VEKGHAIAMDGLQQQLQKSLAANTHLEEQLKDRERQNLKKEKEIEDLRKAVADFEKRHAGFNEVLNHFQDTLLGTIASHTLKFAISAMPYVTRLLFPLCSLPGARRGGFH
jgi:septal ring factor EnvC (AmiA/AmiB activator)